MKVELTTIELKALELKDINNFNDKKNFFQFILLNK